MLLYPSSACVVGALSSGPYRCCLPQVFECACASAQALARQLTPELVLSQSASLGIEQKPLAAPKPVIEQQVIVSGVTPAGLVQRSYQAAAAASG